MTKQSSLSMLLILFMATAGDFSKGPNQMSGSGSKLARTRHVIKLDMASAPNRSALPRRSINKTRKDRSGRTEM